MLHVWILACVDICESDSGLVPEEDRKELLVPWNWSYRCLWDTCSLHTRCLTEPGTRLAASSSWQYSCLCPAPSHSAGVTGISQHLNSGLQEFVVSAASCWAISPTPRIPWWGFIYFFLFWDRVLYISDYLQFLIFFPPLLKARITGMHYHAWFVSAESETRSSWMVGKHSNNWAVSSVGFHDPLLPAEQFTRGRYLTGYSYPNSGFFHLLKN